MITAGAVIGVFGVSGELKVKPLIDGAEILKKGLKAVLVGKDGKIKNIELESARFHKGNWLIRISGVMSPEAGRLLTGSLLKLPEDALPEPGEDEVYWVKIEGAEVLDSSGNPVGVLVGYIETGSHDVFEIEGQGGKKYLISNNPLHVLSIDSDAKTVIIDPIGLVAEE